MVFIKRRMRLKVDISKKIVILDSKRLGDEIAKFECLTNQSAYLFMNKNTMNSLMVATSPFAPDAIDDSYIIKEYTGRKVYQNDELEFGEIEIR